MWTEPVALPGSLGRKITDTKAKLAAAQFPGRGTLSKGWRLLTYVRPALSGVHACWCK